MNWLQNSTNSFNQNNFDISNHEINLSQILIVIELIKSWLDKDFNLLFAKHFKLKYWRQTTIENLRLFTSFLIQNINSYIDCCTNFPSKWVPSKEKQKLAIKVTQFEEEFHEILYFWQRDISQDIRNEVDRILSIIVN